MKAETKNMMREVAVQAWRFVKQNGFSLSEAFKTAWQNIKLKAALRMRIVKFWFTKISGEVREAYGTLNEALMPTTQGCGRRPNDTVTVYFDTEKSEFRCFKRANLLRVEF